MFRASERKPFIRPPHSQAEYKEEAVSPLRNRMDRSGLNVSACATEFTSQVTHECVTTSCVLSSVDNWEFAVHL